MNTLSAFRPFHRISKIFTSLTLMMRSWLRMMSGWLQLPRKSPRAGSPTRLLRLNNVMEYRVYKHMCKISNFLTYNITLCALFPSIDDSLNLYNDWIKVEFSKRWSKHRCSVPGCSTVLIFDGGCKVRFIKYFHQNQKYVQQLQELHC